MSVLPLEIARKKLDLGLVPGKEQSKVSGGTAEELPMERKKATFDIEVMTNCLDGGKDQTARRRFFQRGTLVSHVAPKRAWVERAQLAEHSTDFDMWCTHERCQT